MSHCSGPSAHHAAVGGGPLDSGYPAATGSLGDVEPTAAGVLLVVAIHAECAGLVAQLGLRETWRSEGGQQALLEGVLPGPRPLPLRLAVTGVLEHNAVA